MGKGGATLAEGLKGNSTLQSLDVCNNSIIGEGAESLAKAALEHLALTSFCEILLTSLRKNSLEELDLEGKGFGVLGAIVLSSLLPSASALKSLNLKDNDLTDDAKQAIRQAVAGRDVKVEV